MPFDRPRLPECSIASVGMLILVGVGCGDVSATHSQQPSAGSSSVATAGSDATVGAAGTLLGTGGVAMPVANGGATAQGGNATGGSSAGGNDALDVCPSPAEPDLFGNSIDVRVTISWDQVLHSVSPMGYGLNGFAAFDPQQTSDPTYLANLLHMKPGILRLHNMAVLEDSTQSEVGWIDNEARSWDAEKIGAALTPLVDAGINLMINIPHWPSWMDVNDDRKLDADKFDAFAAFMAELVRIVNVENALGVKYWEVTNELEYRFQLLTQPEQMNQVVDLYNRACKAMKAVDPTILTGGPAISRADLTDLVTRFVHGTAPQASPTTLDFFTFHSYGGDGTNPDQDAYTAAADWVSGYGRSLSKILADESPARKIPLWYDEFAVTYAWDSKDPRTTNHKGAVWDALAVTSALDNGVDWTSSWNEKDGTYGKMDPNNQLRVTAQLYVLFNRWLVGERVGSASELPDQVAVFAVKNADQRGVLLINRTDSAQSANLTMTGWTPMHQEPLVISRIDASGFRRNLATWSEIEDALVLPAHSVVLIAGGDPACQ